MEDEKPPDMMDQLRFITDRLKKLEVATGNHNGATRSTSTPADEVVDLEAMTRTQLLEYAKNSSKTREDLSKTAAEESSRRVRFDED